MSQDDDLEMPIPFGISADTGAPLNRFDESSLKSYSKSKDADAELREYLEAKADSTAPKMGVLGDIRDPNNLSKTGWAVMFAPSADQGIREALGPLLKHRAEQVNDPATFKVFAASAGNKTAAQPVLTRRADPPNKFPLYRVFEGETGYRPGDTAETWLRDRFHLSMDVVTPSAGVPFYLMIVGPPDEISYEFQYGLDLYWAVGRVWFPSADEFRQYADSVVKYETMAAADIPTSKQMAVFATCHDLDPATQAFSSQVATTMVTGTDTMRPAGEAQDFALQPFIGKTAMRDTLKNIFTGTIDNGTPAVLFSGGHGKAFGPDDEDAQKEGQGALICQDWQGYGYKFTRDHYLEASDLPKNLKVHGMVHFMFACYGGGWPTVDTYDRTGGAPKVLANRPMMARLPQALLSHRDGGALAVLAHIDRAWAYSFKLGKDPQTQGFRDVLARIMWGDRLGLATDQFNMRWANLSRNLAETLDKARGGLTINLKALANQWVARDDARNYILFGDPAVRLRVDDMPAR